MLPIVRILALLALFVAVTALQKVTFLQKQVLVVHDPAVLDQSIGELLRLYDNYNINFVDYNDESAELFIGEEAIYHHVVFLPSSKRSAAAKDIVNKHILLEFFNKGGNVVAVNSDTKSVPDEVREFLNEAGIYPAPRLFKLSDHFADLKISNDNVVSRVYPELSERTYSGSAALISNNEFVIPLIKAPKTSYCANPKEAALTNEKTWTLGEQGYLAVAFQGLNNARVAWVGSEDLLNADLVSWVFQEKNVLKLQFVEHFKSSEPGFPSSTLYRIKDEVYYTAGVSEYKNREWVPYFPSAKDDVLQLSFKMLDAYQRLNLTLMGPGASTENGVNDLNIFFVEFTIPDHHGMFTFELDYKRSGLSFLEDNRVVTVRHLANDEYKRSWAIPNAWMYMTSALLVVVAWFVFVGNFLYIGVAEQKTETTKAEKTVTEKKAEKKAEEKAEKKEKKEKSEK